MWKRVKLLGLITVTLGLAVLTYPTWRGITASARHPTDWSWNDSLAVVAQPGSGYQIRAALHSDYGSFDERDAEGSSSLRFRLYGTNTTGPLASQVYLVATGTLAFSLRDCKGSTALPPQPISLEDAPAFLKDYHNTQLLGSGDIQILQVNSFFATCRLPTNMLWTLGQDGLLFFSAPPVYAVTPAPDFALSDDVAHCVEVGAYYPSGYSVVYQSPPGAPPEIDPDTPASAPPDNTWRDCDSTHKIALSCVDDADLGLNDVEAASAASRNLFLAGVFAGVLGALAIEIFNGTFDVAEHWSARRRTRHDEQEQRPEPTPDQPPEPDDEVDRDQLPLF